jgi:hypothetical protein
MKLPIYCIVGARPVKVVPRPDGGFEILMYDWDAGGFITGARYLERVLFPAGDPEIDYVDADEFERRLVELRERRQGAR